MNKQIKIGIYLSIIILLIASTLFSLFNNQSKENKSINNEQQENTKTNIPNKKESQGSEAMENQKIKLSINNHKLTATLNNNSSSMALVEELKEGPITINMSDYANMEKVGDLGVNLPRNDESITTSAGDLILYQGHNFVIYYDTNHWSLTRLGKIDNINGKDLKNILGNGDVTVKLSLKK